MIRPTAKAITELWQGSDDGRSFSAGLERAGYELARGKRGYVVIDHAGEIHSLTRQIEGARKKDVAARLGNQLPLERLPDAESLATPGATIGGSSRNAPGRRPGIFLQLAAKIMTPGL